MVVVENGESNKTEYRKFKIQKSSQNDIAALQEILERRFAHSEWKFPDIIVLDGAMEFIHFLWHLTHCRFSSCCGKLPNEK